MNTDRCPKCEGEMRHGEAYVLYSTSKDQLSSAYGDVTMPAMSMPGIVSTRERVMWQEKTGRRKGWLLKSDEKATLSIFGRRCTSCGYIEFFALGDEEKRIREDVKEI